MKVIISIDREHLVSLINSRLDVPVVPESTEAKAISTIVDIACELFGEIDYVVGPVSIATENG